MRTIITASLLLIFFTPCRVGLAYEGFQASVGVDFLDFHYKEFDDNGVLLDREDGLLPGVTGELTNWLGRKRYFSLAGSYHAADITYDGQTQSGVPAKTITDTEIVNFYASFGERIGHGNSNDVMYAGLGHRRWWRNILPGYDINGNPVNGLPELYTWNYLQLGFKRIDTLVGWDVRLQYMLDARMRVLGMNFDLGEEWMLRLAVPVRINMGANLSMIIEPYLESFDLGRSQNVIVPPYIYYEPRSETRNVGVAIKLQW